MPDTSSNKPSPLHQQRKRAILELACAAQQSRVRRRRVVQGSTAIALVIIAVAGIQFLMFQNPATPTDASDSIAGTTPHETVARAAPTMQSASFALVSTSPAAASRITIVPTPRALPIDDEELLVILHETGRDVGLVRTGSRVLLAEHQAVRQRPEDTTTPGTPRGEHSDPGDTGAHSEETPTLSA